MNLNFFFVLKKGVEVCARAMKHACISTTLLLGLACMNGCCETPQLRFARVDGKQILTPAGEPILLRGINLGNWLMPEGYMFKLEVATAPWQIEQLVKELVGPAEANAFWKKFRANYITRADIRYLKQLGLNSLRLPFNYKLLTPEDHPEIWLEEGFALLDSAVAWSKAESLYVILDMHAAPCGQTGTNIDDSVGHPWLFESTECQDRLVEVWKKIAERYRNEPTVLGYDLLNEPIPHFAGYDRFNPQLEPLYQRLVAAIRTIDPHHIIFLGGAQWNSNFKVFGPPFDKNLVYTFHKYWTPPEQAQIQEYLDFSAQHTVPLWLGESGENTDEWIATFRALLETHNIGWCFWPYKKMEAPSCLRSFEKPPHWEEIVAYEKMRNLDPEKIKQHRPPIAHSRAALAVLLENVRFDHTRANDGYIAALGLK